MAQPEGSTRHWPRGTSEHEFSIDLIFTALRVVRVRELMKRICGHMA
jgi:hypothetical protein